MNSPGGFVCACWPWWFQSVTRYFCLSAWPGKHLGNFQLLLGIFPLDNGQNGFSTSCCHLHAAVTNSSFNVATTKFAIGIFSANWLDIVKCSAWLTCYYSWKLISLLSGIIQSLVLILVSKVLLCRYFTFSYYLHVELWPTWTAAQTLPPSKDSVRWGSRSVNQSTTCPNHLNLLRFDVLSYGTKLNVWSNFFIMSSVFDRWQFLHMSKTCSELYMTSDLIVRL